ncbi:MAG: hypothetical protein QOI12_2658 [Alphaproteobacteria bacterium]|jgi:uncharacterized protein YndB with AHSA1/START domain|nr:hypothetical protein [Alphaproteobacteria bacterium]
MPDLGGPTSTEVSRVINAPREAVYRAFLDQDAVAAWLPPGSMRGVVHAFDGREGGSFSMSLVYPDDDESSRGKTSKSTDTFRGRFVTLIPCERIVWAVEFESADPAFADDDREHDVGRCRQRHPGHHRLREHPSRRPA